MCIPARPPTPHGYKSVWSFSWTQSSFSEGVDRFGLFSWQNLYRNITDNFCPISGVLFVYFNKILNVFYLLYKTDVEESYEKSTALLSWRSMCCPSFPWGTLSSFLSYKHRRLSLALQHPKDTILALHIWNYFHTLPSFFFRVRVIVFVLG